MAQTHTTRRRHAFLSLLFAASLMVKRWSQCYGMPSLLFHPVLGWGIGTSQSTQLAPPPSRRSATLSLAGASRSATPATIGASRSATPATIGASRSATPATIGATAQRHWRHSRDRGGAAWRRLWRFPLRKAETATNGPFFLVIRPQCLHQHGPASGGCMDARRECSQCTTDQPDALK